MAERSTNVIVVGGGSVGLCMSMELGSRNIKNILVNQNHTPLIKVFWTDK